MQQDVVVVPFVELDLATKATFETFLDAHRGSPSLVLDMSGVRFFDSTAMGVLIAEYKGRGSNGTVMVTNLEPAVAKVFEICNVTQLFVVGQQEVAEPR